MSSATRSSRTRKDVPLYEMVDSVLRSRLVERTYPPGAMIPSEFVLADELGVSQGTVRRALIGLVDEGLLIRKQGLGTFVPEVEDRRSLFLFFNIIGRDGRQEMPAAQLIKAEDGAATRAESKHLDVTIGAPVRRLLRVRLFKERPTIIERIVVSESVLPGLGRDEALPDHLFRYYEARFNVTVVDAEQRMRASAATKEEAELLCLNEGAPLLEIERVAYAANRRPVEWRLSRVDTSEHDYRSS